MKPYLLILLGSLSLNLFGQTVSKSPDTIAFATANIKFKSAGVVLDGTLFKPKRIFATIVLVHGSGQELRMTEMATRLAKKGIAVLTYDKRGVGKSGGIYAGPEVGTNNIDSSNLNLLATDAAAACKAILGLLPTKHGPLGLMGASQAGWIIPIAAVKNRAIKFMVIFSGPVVTTLEQLRFQFYTNGNAKFWETHTEVEARDHVHGDADRYQFSATDPRVALTKLSIRGLWLFGGKDIQIPVGLSIENLNSLKALGKPYEHRLFPALGHNTAFSKSEEPVHLAVEWIKGLGQ